jgi:hypothetical protein
VTGDAGEWWAQMLAQPDIPIAKLVDDFDAIAARAIPYA